MSFKKVNKLEVETKVASQKIIIEYQMDNLHAGSLSIDMPFDISAYEPIIKGIFGLWGGVFLAQLCLAEEVHLREAHTLSVAEEIMPIVQNLYALRAYREGIDLLPPPRFIIQSTLPHKPKSSNKNVTNKKVCLLWSGGIDSTLALSLLRKNDYNVIPIHVTINTGAIDGEIKAVQAISKRIDLGCNLVKYEFSDYLSIAKKYSRVVDIYPSENPVPHGRELLLVPIALIFALRHGADSICLGHENNAWTRTINYNGVSIYRCDTQSEPANIIMQQYIREHVVSQASLFSAVAPFSDFLKFKLLDKLSPELLSQVNACFWGNWCGQCGKCSLYYVLQRLLGGENIKFASDPISTSQILKNIVYNWEDENQTNWAEYQYSLYKIVESGKFHESETLLIDYKERVYPSISRRIAELEKRLHTVHNVKLLPQGFKLFAD